MDTYKTNVEQAAAWVSQRCSHQPRVGILTGTGLGGLADTIVSPAVFDYEAIPHFPSSTAPGHAGRLVLGGIGAVDAALFQGRLHLYEGYSPRQVTFPVRVMQRLGVKCLIVSNAAGGINADYNPGDLMVIADHLNLTGENPLVGPNASDWGLRFPDMGEAYAPGLRDLSAQQAAALGIHLRQGIYAGLKGPSLETPAEIRYLQAIGADAVGFSTVQESIAAVHAGMQVLGLSIITNVHQPDAPQPATIEDIIEEAEAATPRLVALIEAVLKQMPDGF